MWAFRGYPVRNPFGSCDGNSPSLLTKAKKVEGYAALSSNFWFGVILPNATLGGITSKLKLMLGRHNFLLLALVI